MGNKKIKSMFAKQTTKRKRSIKTLGLIATGSAIVAATIIPTLSLTSCKSSWNEYFVKPKNDVLKRQITRLNTSIDYELYLKEDIPLESDLNISIVQLTNPNPIEIKLVEGSVSYLKKKLKFQLEMKPADPTSKNDVETYSSDFKIDVECKRLLGEKEVIWTTELNGFNISLDREVPLEKTVTCPKREDVIDLIGDDSKHAEFIFYGFSTNVNPSFLVSSIEIETPGPRAKYSTNLVQINDDAFKMIIQAEDVTQGTDETIDFHFHFKDKMDPNWSADSPKYTLHTRYGFNVLLEEGAETEISIELDSTDEYVKTVELGEFSTNIDLASLSCSYEATGLGETNAEIVDIVSKGSEGPRTKFAVIVNFSKTSSIEKSVDFVLSFYDEWHKRPFSEKFTFKINIKLDIWCGRSAFFVTNETTHWITDLEESCICCSTSDPIVDDKGNSFPRATFNHVLTLRDSIENIPSDFLSGCTTYNQYISLPSKLKKIGDNFMNGCTEFNSNIVMGDTVTGIGKNFLKDCISYNRQLKLGKSINDINDGFLEGCEGFNERIKFNEKLKIIHKNFLKGCTNYNQPLVLPNLTNVGDSFLEGCTSFNQNLVLPNTLVYVGKKFMYCVDNMQKILNIKLLPLEIFAGGESSDEYTLASSNKSAPMVINGVQIIGDNKYSFCEKFADYSTADNARNTKTCNFDIKYLGSSSVDGKFPVDLDAPAGVKSFETSLWGFQTNHDSSSIHLDVEECPDFFDAKLSQTEGHLHFDLKIKDRTAAVTARTFDVKCNFYWQAGDKKEEKKLTFKFNITDDLWKNRQAYTVDSDGNKIWFDTLEGSGLCDPSDDEEGRNIVGFYDDGKSVTFKRNEFNKEIFLNPSLKEIPSGFLAKCKKFGYGFTDEILHMPLNLTTIRSRFLYECENFNQNLIFASSIATIESSGFMYGTDNMTGILNFQDIDTKAFGEDDLKLPFLGNSSASAASIVNGVQINGFNDKTIYYIIDFYPNMSQSNRHRNLKPYHNIL